MSIYYTPAGSYSNFAEELIKQPHLLIAGATGSGKSVLLNTLIYTTLYRSPAKARFVLIDPKRVELCDYLPLPHTLAYASEKAEIRAAINYAVQLMEYRYSRMQAVHIKHTTEPPVYVIIDEFADLMTTDKKAVLPSLCRLAQLGRAAEVHLWLATQRPTRDIITGQIKVNIDARVALRCPTAQDSRNIINTDGAERLPRYGEGYYLSPDTMYPEKVKIPYTPQAEINRLISWWINQR